MIQGTITKVAGPLVIASQMRHANLFDVVRVSQHNLLGEIIEIHGDLASIQVYEETAGLGPGDTVTTAGHPLSVELGPGLMGRMYDGIQRPLEDMVAETGPNIHRGVMLDPISRTRRWDFVPAVKPGDAVEPGDIIGTVQETAVVVHKIMVPYGVSGVVERIERGQFTVADTVCVVKTQDGEAALTMLQRWPVRKGRPYKEKKTPSELLVTGQRVIDTFFPLAKGGVAAVPGPFGSGKTVVQHQLAKWADADIVVYIGCGERGNEMTDVLREFPELTDPRTGKSIMERTVLIANTSDMPVAAREASIYTGITIAEYFRDMGYHVALMADSTSRWAEALREMSGRLEEMPGEEGYPAYLGSRLAQFYERAGRVVSLGKEGREGTLTAIGAVSPPGGDLSEPVTQATLRIVKVFFALDATLAYRRHFPAINWLRSYSLYQDEMDSWLDRQVGGPASAHRKEAMALLQTESELEEIVRLVGIDALSGPDRLVLEAARSIREDFLHQNAFHEVDTFSSLHKQYRLLALILQFYRLGKQAVTRGVSPEALIKLPALEQIGRAKYVAEAELDERYTAIEAALVSQIGALTTEGRSEPDDQGI